MTAQNRTDLRSAYLYLVCLVTLVLVIAAWAAPGALRGIEDRYDRVTGRDYLKALERDGLLSFRVPGTTLRETLKQRGYDGSPGRSGEPASVEQNFALEGDAVAAIEAYRDRAEADGWLPAGSYCSRYNRAAKVILTKSILTKSSPIPAVLTVWAGLAGAPPGADLAPGAANPAGSGLSLTLETGYPDAGAWPLSDIGCLRSINPEDPAFKVRPGPARTPAELCALLPVDRVRQVVPDVTMATPAAPDQYPAGHGRSGCFYEQRPYTPPSPWLPVQARIDSRTWFTVVDAAGYPRIKYEERKHPSATTTANNLLLLVSDSQPAGYAGPPVNAWVNTPTGPVEVSTGHVDGLDQRQLVAIAALLAGDS
jgi:hypothetical protein